jgi:hypothetical protein
MASNSTAFYLQPPFRPLPLQHSDGKPVGFWMPSLIDWLPVLLVQCITNTIPVGVPAARNQAAMKAAAEDLLLKQERSSGRLRADVLCCVAGRGADDALRSRACVYVQSPETWARKDSTANVLAAAFVKLFTATNRVLPHALVGVFRLTHDTRDVYIGVHGDDAHTPASCIATLKLLTIYVYSCVGKAPADAASGCCMADTHACVKSQVETSMRRLFDTAAAFRNIARGAEVPETLRVHADDVSEASKHMFALLQRDVEAIVGTSPSAPGLDRGSVVQVGCHLIDVLLHKHAELCGVAPG